MFKEGTPVGGAREKLTKGDPLVLFANTLMACFMAIVVSVIIVELIKPSRCPPELEYSLDDETVGQVDWECSTACS